MGSVGETVEEIIAEEDETGFVQGIFEAAGGFIGGYGWYLLAGGVAAYYIFKNYGPNFETSNASGKKSLTASETADFQRKEEARLRYISKLQEQYEKDTLVKAEKDKQREDEKRKARLAELERLEGKNGTDSGHRLGDSASAAGPSGTQPKPKSAQSFRPEYNPLMGDTASYRACSSRSSGRAGG